MAEIGSRKMAILAALRRELDRHVGKSAGDVDAEALARAVDAALGDWEPPEVDELSKEPDELNASNDV